METGVGHLTTANACYPPPDEMGQDRLRVPGPVGTGPKPPILSNPFCFGTRLFPRSFFGGWEGYYPLSYGRKQHSRAGTSSYDPNRTDSHSFRISQGKVLEPLGRGQKEGKTVRVWFLYRDDHFFSFFFFFFLAVLGFELWASCSTSWATLPAF
jgi:hypothetical protein